uniref:Bestrophin homolog n=1 Tax=Acrobeloides nanus TaxID=290746 RepID=A0A914EB99_9BILA
MYRFWLPDSGKVIFEQISIYSYTLVGFIPLNFMLGFYVTAVFGRWTTFLSNIGLIDTPGLYITSNIRGTNQVAVNVRRTLIRYIALFQTIVFYYVSKKVKKRFPNTDKMVEAGIMTQEESNIFKNLDSTHGKFWLPAQWIFNLLRKAKDLNLFESDFIYMNVVDKVSNFRASAMRIVLYDLMPIPLIYTQVVNLTIDLYIPIIYLFQFIFYLGWIKAAEVMLNPFGEDDDDFEINYVLDRNLDVGYLMVDGCYNSLPCEPYLDKVNNDTNVDELKVDESNVDESNVSKQNVKTAVRYGADSSVRKKEMKIIMEEEEEEREIK